MAGEDEVRWNSETQRWETGAPRGRFTPPPPPRPEFGPTPAPDVVPGPDPVPSPDVPVSRPGLGGVPRLPAKVITVLTAVVLVGAGAGFGGWYLWGREGDGVPADNAGRKVTTAPATGDASPSEPAQTDRPTTLPPSPSGPPPGYRTASDGEFGIVVPEGWQLRTAEKLVTVHYYEEPGGRRFVQVFRVTERDATPLSTLRTGEKDLEGSPGYRRNGLEELPDERGEAAELDYSYRSERRGTEVRVLERVFHADEDTLYAVLSYGPADAWPRQQVVLQKAVDSFCLGVACSP